MEHPHNGLMAERDEISPSACSAPIPQAAWRRHTPRMLFCALLWATGATAATCDDQLLVGTWDAGDRASQARYGRLWVSASHLQWSGSRVYPGCRLRYTVAARETGDTYRDALPGPAGPDRQPPAPPNGENAGSARANIASPSYAVFRLALQKKPCAGGRSAMQFAIPVANPDRAELITYDENSRPVTWGHFERLPVR